MNNASGRNTPTYQGQCNMFIIPMRYLHVCTDPYMHAIIQMFKWAQSLELF